MIKTAKHKRTPSYLEAPLIKTAIHKPKKLIASTLNKKLCLAFEQIQQDTSKEVPHYKRKLSIRIPTESEAKLWTPGIKVRSVADYADTDEIGSFYSIALKKSDYKRYNEDRVRVLFTIVHDVFVFSRSIYKLDGWSI